MCVVLLAGFASRRDACVQVHAFRVGCAFNAHTDFYRVACLSRRRPEYAVTNGPMVALAGLICMQI